MLNFRNILEILTVPDTDKHCNILVRCCNCFWVSSRSCKYLFCVLGTYPIVSITIGVNLKLQFPYWFIVINFLFNFLSNIYICWTAKFYNSTLIIFMTSNNQVRFIVFDVCWPFNGYAPPECAIFIFEYSFWLSQQRLFYIFIFDDGIITSLRNDIMSHWEVISWRH